MEPTISPTASPVPPGRNWWQRNWIWFVPTGCLTFIVAVLGFVALIAFVVFGAMKSSDAYKHALAAARSNPAVVEALGTPIADAMFLSGSTHVDGSGGEADLAIPISGPKGKGKIFVTATKAAGQWKYDTLVVELSGSGQRINLLDNVEPEPEPAEETSTDPPPGD